MFTKIIWLNKLLSFFNTTLTNLFHSRITDRSKVFQGHCHQYVNSGIYLAQEAQQSLNRGAVWGTSEFPGIIVNVDPSKVGAPPAGQ